ncbi:hypothetical protein ACFS07_02415 [Undibacterium arcticum]
MLGSRVVYATIPHSDKQTQIIKHHAKSNPMQILAQAAPQDVAIESLRFFSAPRCSSRCRSSKKTISF